MKKEATHSSLNLKVLLSSALTRCMDIVESKSGSIFLLDDGGRELVLKVACWPKRKSLEDIRQRLGEGVAGWVASRREPILVKDINEDPRFKKRFGHYRTNSFLSAPLEAGDKLIGVINITEKISHGPFTSDELESICSVTTYIALAIEKLRLYEELNRSNRRLKEKIEAMEAQQKRWARENMDLKKEIELSKKMASVGRLAAGIVHELNNPLDGVIRYTNLSLDWAGQESIVGEYLLEAKKGLSRMVKIIRSLLDFAKTQKTPQELKSIDINRVLDDSIFMMSHYYISNNIEVAKKFSKRLPLVGENGLKLVFTNLLKNACDAMPKGGAIKVSTGIKNGFIEVKFQDTGPGIPEEVRDKIFEPFFTTKQMDKGAGLGLAICYDVIQRHNGKIKVKSKEGKGSTFTVQLPFDGRAR